MLDYSSALNYSYLSNPKYLINTYENWRPTEYIHNVKKPVDDIKSFEGIKVYKPKIIFAGDPGYASCHRFSIFMEKIFHKKYEEHYIHAMYLMSLDDKSIMQSLYNRGEFSDIFKRQVEIGKIKDYFDYNWNKNSVEIIGEKLKMLNIFNNYVQKPFISKYSLQLLYFIASNPSLTETQLHSHMHRWNNPKNVSLGSSTSRDYILENLQKMHLIEEHHQRISVSKLGNMLLSLLSEGMDLDLPAKLDYWMTISFEKAKNHIDNYITTYFNKIKD